MLNFSLIGQIIPLEHKKNNNRGDGIGKMNFASRDPCCQRCPRSPFSFRALSERSLECWPFPYMIPDGRGRASRCRPATRFNSGRMPGISGKRKFKVRGREFVPPSTVPGSWNRRTPASPARTWCQAVFRTDTISVCNTGPSCDVFPSQ